MVSVTNTTAGDPCAPDAVTVTCPVYDPGARPAAEAETCTLCGAVPLTGDTRSQLASPEAVKFSVPEPMLLTFNEAGRGSGPPWAALNDRLDGVTERIG